MTEGLTIKRPFHVGRGRRSRKEMRSGCSAPALPAGRVPRVSRLLALAIRFDGLIRDGVVADQAELARLGHVSRARISQVMGLLYLAPDIQEAVLFLPRVERGRDPVKLRDLLPVSAEADWAVQGELWEAILRG